MRSVEKLRLRIRTLFRRSRVERELDAELAFHLDELTHENVAAGMSAEDARFAALRSIGGIAQIKEECRDTRRTGFVDSTLQDLRYASRMLWRNPGFTATAVACLAIGIGANTAVFTVINAALLRPLPFPQPERLVGVWEETPMFGLRYSPPAVGNYVDWRSQNHVFESIGALEGESFRLTGSSQPEQVSGSLVSASLFRTLRVEPLRGRLFRDEEDKPGTPKIAIIGYGLWHRRFGGAESAIGSMANLNDQKYTIVGVMPAGFRFPEADAEVWAPIGTEYPASEFTNRDRHNLMVVARLAPGVTTSRANDEIRAIATRAQRIYPATNKDVGAFVAPLRDHMIGGFPRLSTILFAAVSFVLLIACANVANLMLSRAVGRGKEIAVRAALGAGKMRVTRQLVTEHLLLASVGGVAGIVLAFWSMGFLKYLVPDNLAAFSKPGPDWRVLLFSVATTAAACVLFSLAPIAQALRTDLNDALKQSGGRAGISRGNRTTQRALVVAEIALALVLLIGAGLLIRTFARLRGVEPGFRTSHLLTLNTPLPWQKYREPARRIAYYQQVIERVTSLPGVVSAGFTTGVPLAFKGFFVGVLVDASKQFGADTQTVTYRVVTPDYLRTMGIPLVSGRYLDERDGPQSLRVGLVNETMARRFWPNQDAIGKRFKHEMAGSWVTVAGVVRDIRQSGLDVPTKPEIYLPYQQEQTLPPSLVIRTAGDPMRLADAVRREIWNVDKDQPVTDIQTMEDIVDREVFARKLQMLILAFFAGSALLLASIGIYGMFSYFVTQKRREICLRMALGASSSDVLSGIVGQGAVLTVCGIAIGLAASAGLTHLMSNLLFGVGAMDPVTFAGVPLLLLAVGLLASYIPARRAMKADPALALRDE